MSAPTPTDPQAQKTSSIGDLLRLKAAEAREQKDFNTAQIIRIEGKEYYVVVIKDGKLQQLPQAEKIKELAKVVIGAHTSPETLNDRKIDYIDSLGAHFIDEEAPKTHSEASLNPELNTQFEEILYGTKSEKKELTKAQEEILELSNYIEQTENLEAEELRKFAIKQNIPREISQAVTQHIDDASPIKKEDVTRDFKIAIATYTGKLKTETIKSIPEDGPVKYESAIPTGEALATLKSKAETQEHKQFSKNLAGDFATHNAAARNIRTAKHAWDAMEELAFAVEKLNPFIVPVNREDPPLNPPTAPQEEAPDPASAAPLGDADQPQQVEKAPDSIALKEDKGERYEQLEQLTMKESVQDWDKVKSTHQPKVVCQEILTQLDQKQAQLAPYHLSMLKKIITGYKINPDYNGANSAQHFWALEQRLRLNV